MLKKLQDRNGDKEYEVYGLGWVCVVSFLTTKLIGGMAMGGRGPTFRNIKSMSGFGASVVLDISYEADHRHIPTC
jgi:hypothetical protein